MEVAADTQVEASVPHSEVVEVAAGTVQSVQSVGPGHWWQVVSAVEGKTALVLGL